MSVFRAKSVPWTSLIFVYAVSEDSEPVYMYYMKQQLRCHHEDEYSIDLQKKVTFCECDHGDDVVFTFGVPLMNGKMMTQCKFSEEEKELTKAWMTYITNFATNGCVRSLLTIIINCTIKY